MSHTTIIAVKDEGEGHDRVYAIHNGDFSGLIVLDGVRVTEGSTDDEENTWGKAFVPYEVIEHLVALKLRGDWVSWVEQAPQDEVLAMGSAPS